MPCASRPRARPPVARRPRRHLRRRRRRRRAQARSGCSTAARAPCPVRLVGPSRSRRFAFRPPHPHPRPAPCCCAAERTQRSRGSQEERPGHRWLGPRVHSGSVAAYCSLHEFWRWTISIITDFRRFSLGRGAGGKRLSGAVCGCRGKWRLGAHPTDTR